MYVPGDKSKMIDKMVAMDQYDLPDVTVLDLEDAVSLNNKV